MFRGTFGAKGKSLLYADTENHASDFSFRLCVDVRAPEHCAARANEPEIPAAAQGDCRDRGGAAYSDDPSLAGSQGASERDADRTAFGIAVDRRFGATGISAGGPAVQSADERTEPRALHHLAQNSGVD